MRWLNLFLYLLILVGITACDPPARAPDVVMRRPDQSVTALKTDAEPSFRDEAADVRRLVDESLVLENGEELTVEEWLRKKMESRGGQIMFPRWNVRRRGANKFDVTFVYTVLMPDYTIEKEGFTWRVDAVLRLVSAPTGLDEKDMERQSGAHPPTGRPSEQGAGLFRLE